MNAGHGIIQMGHMGSPSVKGSLGFLIICVSVSHRDGAQGFGPLNELHRARKLRSHIHNADEATAPFLQGLERLKIGITQVSAVLCSFFLLREKGALHLNPHQPGQACRRFLLQPLCRGERLGQHIIRKGHGSGGKRGNATAAQVGSHGLEALVIPIGKVPAGVAMVVYIHQARNYVGPLQVHCVCRNGFRQNLSKSAVFHRKSTCLKAKILGINLSIFIIHHIAPLMKKGALQEINSVPFPIFQAAHTSFVSYF